MKPDDPNLPLNEAWILSIRGKSAEALLSNAAFPLWMLEDPEKATRLWRRCHWKRYEQEQFVRHWLLVDEDEEYEIWDDFVEIAHTPSMLLLSGEMDFIHNEYHLLPTEDGEVFLPGWSFECEIEYGVAMHEYNYVRLWKKGTEEV